MLSKFSTVYIYSHQSRADVKGILHTYRCNVELRGFLIALPPKLSCVAGAREESTGIERAREVRVKRWEREEREKE